MPRFLEHLGFAPQQQSPPEQRNVSLSVFGLIATLAANRLAQTPEQRQTYFGMLRRMRGFYAPSRFIFDLAAAQEVEPLFHEDRARLAAQWGFDASPSPLADAHDSFALTCEELARIETACAALAPEARAEMSAQLAAFVRD